jgi:hypothetical protein
MIDIRQSFYTHPFASIVTAAFLFSLLVTASYYVGLFPDEQVTRFGLTDLVIITGTLLVTTIATWLAAFFLVSADV